MLLVPSSCPSNRMRRPVVILLIGTEIGVLALWFLEARIETGIDALQYHRMAQSIAQNGLAPWTLSPLSYIGWYPGSDSSGVPFLVASFSVLSGIQVSDAILIYDGLLIASFGLGLFLLTRRITSRSDLAIMAVVIGTLAYGFFTTLAWSLDERTFNVAVSPVFLLFAIPRGAGLGPYRRVPRLVALGLVSVLMLVSHLNFLLLLPLLVIMPLLYAVLYRLFAARRRQRTAFLYFGFIGISPILLLSLLNELGILSTSGLEYQLESSAFFSGSSSVIIVANAIVFLATRIGPVNSACALAGLLYLATRPRLLPKDLLLGGLVLVGFLGLPIVVYSKDLLTPILVLLGVVGVHGIATITTRHRALALAVSGILVVSGSLAFNAWNFARTSRAAEDRYWSPLGVTQEMQDANLWIQERTSNTGCAYGNNPVLLQQVTSEPAVPLCTGLALDVALNSASLSAGGTAGFHVTYLGIDGLYPASWFTSPELDKAAADFARLPGMTYEAGKSLLWRYGVSVIVVDLQKPYDIPLYDFQGVQSSVFFNDLWNTLCPVYRSENVAVFLIR